MEDKFGFLDNIPPSSMKNDIPQSMKRDISIQANISRLSTVFNIFRYLLKKALLISITIFVGIFITVIIINRPVSLGFRKNPPQLETNLRKQISQALDIYKFDNPTFNKLSETEQDQVITKMEAKLTEDLGLNLPYWPRHLLWTFNSMKFDWGELRNVSISLLPMLGYGRSYMSLNDIIVKHMPNTMLLAATANILIFLFGVPLSLGLSRKYGSRLDKLFALLAPIFSIPSWVIGIILISIFAFQFRLLPFGGMLDTLPPDNPIGYIPIIAKHMVLPVLAIFLSMFFQLVYSWRTYFLIYAEEDYVILGKAIGLPANKLQKQYVLKPAFQYILTSFSMMLVTFWQMTMALEVIFNWPGIGWLFIKVGLPNFWGESMYPGEMIVAISLIVIFAYILGMVVFILEIIYVVVDPRIHMMKNEASLHQKNSWWKVKGPHQKYVPRLKPEIYKTSSTKGSRININITSWWGAVKYFLSKVYLGIKAAWIQIIHYPAAMFGLVIILLLFLGSLYAVFGLPYAKIGSEWLGSPMTGQPLVPKTALPKWVNLFKEKDYLSTLILDSERGDARRIVTTLNNDSKQINLTYSFDYQYGDFPTEVFLYLDGNYILKRPFTSIEWITPDGREFNLKNTAVIPGTTYNVADNILIRRIVSNNPHLQKWFTFGQIFPTPAFYVLFADPNLDYAKVVPGKYTVRLNGMTFEKESDIQAKLVLLGQVYGLAGTDNMRRDLLTPLLWGMPIALGVGLFGAIITTIISMILSAAGVWFGGWVDNLIQRLTEVNLVLPILAMSVLAYAYLGVNLWVILIIVVLLNVFGSPTKNFRAAFLVIKEAPYIEAAQSYGASNSRIIMRYMLPRIIPTMIPQLIILIPSFVFIEVTLGLFNINTGYPTWGTIIYQAIEAGALYHGQYRLLEPLALVLLTGISFSLFGFTLEKILNPRLLNE
jgi:peptide/nickel transport system permease protein